MYDQTFLMFRKKYLWRCLCLSSMWFTCTHFKHNIKHKKASNLNKSLEWYQTWCLLKKHVRMCNVGHSRKNFHFIKNEICFNNFERNHGRYREKKTKTSVTLYKQILLTFLFLLIFVITVPDNIYIHPRR